MNDKVHQIDWNNHQFTDRAVLCFIQTDSEILLIHKKKGLGAGKINAPGGRIEAGETELDAAIRETQEEIGLTPHHLEKMVELHFVFLDGYSLYCAVFFSRHWEGNIIETDEALAFWNNINTIPYHKMWEDDQYWLPKALSGQKLRGFFVFDKDKMLDHRLEIVNIF
ncbi:MAG: 8-oxo-dGTP diphosphatase [Spirochaetales bacterium]|nr:8-oxo-dGTP diphosphatase [Spirochaetales bacterium]